MITSPVGADRRSLYSSAQTFPEFLASATENEALWIALTRRATIPRDLVARAQHIPGTWHLLVLLEHWCGDAVNTVPVLSRLVEQAPNLSLRVLKRDQHPAVMDQHRTNGKRAIPVVMLLDGNFQQVGWWDRDHANCRTGRCHSASSSTRPTGTASCAAGTPWIAGEPP